MSLAAIAAATVAVLVAAVGRYPQKAARSGEVYRALVPLATEWEALWSGVYDRDDADLRLAWIDLARRQGAVLERVPIELPVWNRLAFRSEREADAYWTQRYASA